MTKNIKIALLMYAAMMVAVVLTGCSGNDFVEEVELEERAIEFTSSTNNATRGSISNTTDLAKAGGFDVWGYKAKTASPMNWEDGWYQVFNGTRVYADTTKTVSYQEPDTENNTDPTKWTYTDKRYWDQKSSYAFYAAAPTGAGFTFVTGNDQADSGSKLFKITGVTGGASNAKDTKDLMISRNVQKRDGATDRWKNVDFTFNHIMSKVQVKFATEVSGATVTIKEMKIEGWDNAPYNFTQRADYLTKKTNEWASADNNSVAGTAIFMKDDSGLDDETMRDDVKLVLDNSIEGPNNIVGAPAVSYIMVPQTIDNLDITLSYTITYSDGVTDTFNNVKATLKNQTWTTDCVTTYTLIIRPTSIRFSVSNLYWSENNNTSTVIVQ